MTKSSILFLNGQERLHSTVNHPFINTFNGFKYIGITITPNLDTLISANYDPIISNISECLNRLTSLPLSLTGHTNIIKINVLLEFLYLFQPIPLAPPF